MTLEEAGLGKLVMTGAADAQQTLPLWSDVPLNALLCALSVISAILALSSFISVMPAIGGCIRSWKGCVALEHNIHNANDRNIVVLMLSLPFCLLADRFRLLDPELFRNLEPGWHTVMTGAAFAIYVIVHALIGRISAPDKMNADLRAAVRNTPATIFAVYCPIMLASAGILLTFNISDDIIRTVLYSGIAAGFAFSILRTGQIIASRHPFFSTILYLCSLELMPAAFLVISAAVL